MHRRSIAFALLAALTAPLAACGGGSSGGAATSATTTAAAATSVPATAAATTAAARATLPAPSPAPATAAPAPTTAAPAATSAATTAAAPPAALVGPPVALVSYVESPMATRRESNAPGMMVRASNPAFDRSFVLTMNGTDVTKLPVAPGWKLEVLARDPQWTPGSCGETARVFVGHRWEVYVDLPSGPTATSADASRLQIISYDTRTGKMVGYLEQPNRVGWMTSQLAALDDHTVGVLFDPAGPSDPTGARTPQRLALRRIDLATGAASDVELPAVPGEGIVAGEIDVDGSVLVTKGPAAAPVSYRWIPGRAPQPLRTPDAEGRLTPVDGVAMDWGHQDASGDIPMVEVATGKVVARVHSWRFMANGPGIGYVGWSSGRGYFGAFTTEPTAGTVRVNLSPGVYDTRNATWDWLFAEPLPADIGFFLVGLV